MARDDNHNTQPGVTRRSVLIGGAAASGAMWAAPAVIGTFQAGAAHGTLKIDGHTPGTYTAPIPKGRAIEYEMSGGGGGGSIGVQNATTPTASAGSAGGAGGTNDRTDAGTTGAAGTDGYVQVWLSV